MQNIHLSFAQDSNTLALALIYGLVPAVVWLFFWLHERPLGRKSSSALVYAFIAGALMVIAALPVEEFLGTFSLNVNTLTILWASAEEALKFLVLLIILFAGSAVEAPVDYAIYAVVVGLGFAGFENALYFLQPLQAGNSVVLVLAASLRFLGTTLMHAAAASLPAIALGFAYYRPRYVKQMAAVLGLVAAAALHGTFNILIAQNGGADSFAVFSLLWFVVILILILFERLHVMGSPAYAAKKRANSMTALKTTVDSYIAKVGSTQLEGRSFVAVLDEKGLPANAPERAELARVIGTLRSAYAAYLASEGARPAEARKAAAALVPDTLSPKEAERIVATLAHAAEVPAEAVLGV